MRLSIIILLLFSRQILSAASNEVTEEPLWEYGLGIGYVRYEDYPSSNHTSTLALPFPTFQYRGKVVRADDREGARAYLYRQNNYSFELGGGVLPALKSTEDNIRSGMESLPWGFQLGPQLVVRPSDDFHIKYGIYQAFFTDFSYTKIDGYLTELKFIYLKYFSPYFVQRSRLQVHFSIKAGSKEFLANYFEVKPSESTLERPQHFASSGFLSYEWMFFQTLEFDKKSFYAGISMVNYDKSTNRASPLHKSDYNIEGFMGITLTLGESQKQSLPEEESLGILRKK